MYVCMYVCIYACMHVRMHVCMYVQCMFICMYMCMYSSIHIQFKSLVNYKGGVDVVLPISYFKTLSHQDPKIAKAYAGL